MGVEPFLCPVPYWRCWPSVLFEDSALSVVNHTRPMRPELRTLASRSHPDSSFAQGAAMPVTHKGYSGRSGIYELALVDDELRAMVVAGATTGVIRNAAIERGLQDPPGRWNPQSPRGHHVFGRSAPCDPGGLGRYGVSVAIYEYKALNRAGTSVNGIIDADNPKSARSKLRVSRASSPRR